MKDILKSNLPLKYQNFWYDMGVKLQKRIKGVVQVFVTPTGLIEIKVFIEKFNYGMYFSFPYELTVDKILQEILSEVESKIYKEVFKNEE